MSTRAESFEVKDGTDSFALSKRFTPRVRKVLELSMREALQLGHNYIGTEHVLLGLIRESEGVAAHALTRMGVGLSELRHEVITVLSNSAKPAAQPTLADQLRLIADELDGGAA